MNRLGAYLTALTAASALVAGPQTGQPFVDSLFLATHNSYSGNVDGAKNSIPYQLDHGVRFVELDVHDNGYAANHDYSIGHSSPGDLVDHNGNPASNLLRDWLNMIAGWSNAHPTHAPLVVMLDLKDDLTDNPNFATGNLTALNAELQSAFGSSLLHPADYVGSPSVDSLRGRVLTLLSGDSGTRTEYKRDVGYHPAVAVNGRGRIVEVHDSGGGALWYWTGTLGADGTVTWLRHGKYDSGVTPAVALNDAGQLVEVHQSQTATTLWYHVGQLGADGEITWQDSHQYDNGVTPTVAFTGSGSLLEVHKSQSSSQNWTWNGVLSGATVSWSGNAKTSSALLPKSSARGVTVYTGADGPTEASTLRYTDSGVTGGRIRYQQTAFDEFQDGDNAVLQQGALFYAAPATDSSFIVAGRQSGHLVRGWDFDSAGDATTPLANYPATNTPWTPWYQSLVSAAVQ
ncbi:hypothetical protein [Kutzneria buriramensis]|uniref:Calcium-dependent phosphoinositide phospholipase C n=1 Tax=Kutzneria buriramensis TaxID=1045776 RepID=A0A3E0I6Q4_9PSEU|nr:hypothetical protein [Kutzneria buriramensis]REH54403.1 calcium-dependent phosphoinositide phospholipase C [Kutzneria buriramensis]